MEIKIRNYQPLYLQEGGPIEEAPVEEAPVEEPALGGDPMLQLAELFMLGLQNQDCNLLALGAQLFLQALGGAPLEAPQGEPVYRRGGRLAYRIKK